MKGLQFIAVVLAVAIAAAAPSLAVAQQGSTKVPVLAFLGNASVTLSQDQLQAFNDALARLGYVEGKNLGYAEFMAPSLADLPLFAAKAVASKPDVIWTVGAPETQALKDATSTIPVVAYTDLVGSGFATSLSHPGANITGVTNFAPDLAAKRLALLREVFPTLKRLTILDIPAVNAHEVAQVTAAAAALGIASTTVDFDSTQDFATQLAGVQTTEPDAVYVSQETWFTDNKAYLCNFLIEHRLPSVFNGNPPFCGLVSYGPNVPAQYAELPSYIDAILKGGKPEDLPIQQATAFDFVINNATAKALGLTIPSTILVQATQVIE